MGCKSMWAVLLRVALLHVAPPTFSGLGCSSSPIDPQLETQSNDHHARIPPQAPIAPNNVSTRMRDITMQQLRLMLASSQKISKLPSHKQLPRDHRCAAESSNSNNISSLLHSSTWREPAVPRASATELTTYCRNPMPAKHPLNQRLDASTAVLGN